MYTAALILFSCCNYCIEENVVLSKWKLILSTACVILQSGKEVQKGDRTLKQHFTMIFLNIMPRKELCVLCSLSHVQLFATPWTVACQAPLSMEFSRQGDWSGCVFLLQGILLTQGSNLYLLCLLKCAGIFFFTTAQYPKESWFSVNVYFNKSLNK